MDYRDVITIPLKPLSVLRIINVRFCIVKLCVLFVCVCVCVCVGVGVGVCVGVCVGVDEQVD